VHATLMDHPLPYLLLSDHPLLNVHSAMLHGHFTVQHGLSVSNHGLCAHLQKTLVIVTLSNNCIISAIGSDHEIFAVYIRRSGQLRIILPICHGKRKNEQYKK
jgi:hypothetical protein